ncbi:MAG: cob(I)yrinic acid a,c-diamide adenosyltransferase [Candidatus Colwellbacteria bacterium]|nr:cob(I)yrinic acid a,c-diamide adenosyltransferase [Candidatus Colwellbacteria bacterium]
MTIVFTGTGKGKTTASLGQAVRAVGRGKRVLMIQFIKGPWQSGEDFAEIGRKEDKGGKFELRKMGLGFVGIMGDTLPREEHIKAAKTGLDYFKKEISNWDLIILDEINVALSLNLLTDDEVLGAIRNFPTDKLLILTGRSAPYSITAVADLVTEMKEIKHPFNKGKLGKLTVEF